MSVHTRTQHQSPLLSIASAAGVRPAPPVYTACWRQVQISSLSTSSPLVERTACRCHIAPALDWAQHCMAATSRFQQQGQPLSGTGKCACKGHPRQQEASQTFDQRQDHLSQCWFSPRRHPGCTPAVPEAVTDFGQTESEFSRP